MPYVFILATITIIWLIKKLVFREKKLQDCPISFMENICHCKLWHNTCPIGWHKEPLLRSAQNSEIYRAFKFLELSVESLSHTYLSQAVTAEDILSDALKNSINFDNRLRDIDNSWGKFPQSLRYFKERVGSCIPMMEECIPLLDLLQWTIEKYGLPETDMGKNDEPVISNIKDIKTKILTELKLHGIKSAVAIDTEMVGSGYRGSTEMVARVSVVNKHFCIYDKYVKPTSPVTDFRTFVSGIQETNLTDAEDFETVQREIKDLIEDRLLVGHDLSKDLRVLRLECPNECVRDTALFRYFRTVLGDGKPSLKNLARLHLCRKIQRASHCSIEDARTTMDLYLKVEDTWERMIQNQY